MSDPFGIALDHAIKGDPQTSVNILTNVLNAAQFNLGWHEMRMGRMKTGFELMASGRLLNVFGSPPLGSGKTIWRGEALEGKKLLLHGEGGFGDQIINLRFARNFKALGAEVIVSVHPSLFRLVRTLDYVDSIVGLDSARDCDHDFWVPAMSAPQVLGLEYENLDGEPYITTDPVILDGDFKVGLKLKGNPEFEHEQHRKFPAELMLGLTDIPGSYYSLDLEHIEGLRNIPMGDWLDTARLIKGLDLVITSCTGVAHLSAAMGVRTWVIVPVMPYYIWALPGNKSPWYKSVTLYRQEIYGDWEKPFTRIREDLNGLRQG